MQRHMGQNDYMGVLLQHPECYYCSTIKSILCFFTGKMPTCDWYWWYYCSTTIFTTCRTNKQFDKIIRFETKDFSRFRGLLSVSFFQTKYHQIHFWFFLIFKFWAKVKKTLALSLPAENQQAIASLSVLWLSPSVSCNRAGMLQHAVSFRSVYYNDTATA